MNIKDIKTVCVVGSGNMGQQIALCMAIAGYKTYCVDISEAAISKARDFVEKYLPGRVAKGKMTQEEACESRERLHFTTKLEDACKEADFVIEAVNERLELKRSVFAELDSLCPPHTVIVTNSSDIVSSKMASVTKRPDKVCNMHFFIPALHMKVVEVVKGPHTSEETVQLTMEMVRSINKNPVYIKKEIYGFVVDRILNALHKEALYLVDNDYASPEDIDIAVEGGLNHPMGPFRLIDFVGIDVIYQIQDERYKETGNPDDAPSPTIAKKYMAGELGRKTGKGFYQY